MFNDLFFSSSNKPLCAICLDAQLVNYSAHQQKSCWGSRAWLGSFLPLPYVWCLAGCLSLSVKIHSRRHLRSPPAIIMEKLSSPELYLSTCVGWCAFLSKSVLVSWTQFNLCPMNVCNCARHYFCPWCFHTLWWYLSYIAIGKQIVLFA